MFGFFSLQIYVLCDLNTNLASINNIYKGNKEKLIKYQIAGKLHTLRSKYEQKIKDVNLFFQLQSADQLLIKP